MMSILVKVISNIMLSWCCALWYLEDSCMRKLHNEPAKVDLNNKMLSSIDMLCQHVLKRKCICNNSIVNIRTYIWVYEWLTLLVKCSKYICMYLYRVMPSYSLERLCNTLDMNAIKVFGMYKFCLHKCLYFFDMYRKQNIP